MVIWRIVDGRRGHDNQSLGLVKALSRHVSCVSHDIPVSSFKSGLWSYLLKKYSPGDSLPKPHLIVGAGHGTHLHLLCARRAYGGRTVVIMNPSLPTAFFDFCLIPDHDNPRITDSIIITRGALNAITPGKYHDSGYGLIMVGGPSRHFGWDDNQLSGQIGLILKTSNNITWHITDSPRTPASTSHNLAGLGLENVIFHSHKNTGMDWATNQLLKSGYVWVTEDSMSMIYESLTAGAATGLLRVPLQRQGKLTNCIQNLISNNMITSFEDWKNGKQLTPPDDILDEANRCAEYLLEKIK